MAGGGRGCKSGMTESFVGQGTPHVSGNLVDPGKGSKDIGIHRVGDTTGPGSSTNNLTRKAISGINVNNRRLTETKVDEQLKKAGSKRSERKGGAIRNNKVKAEADSFNVGLTDSFKGPGQSVPDVYDNEVYAGKVECKDKVKDKGRYGQGQGRPDISGNLVVAGERSENIGIHGVGNTTPDKAPAKNNQPKAYTKNVGLTDSYNGPGQSPPDVYDNKIKADVGAQNIGIHNVGNTTPDKAPAKLTKAPAN